MASSTPCSASSCTRAGTLSCAGCVTPASRYCSEDCQSRDWQTHKAQCASTQKHNCCVVRAAPSVSSTSSPPPFAEHVECFPLADFGTEWTEKAELTRRLGWSVVTEVGKFYDRKGSDTWYYYLYGPGQSAGKKNAVASLACGTTIFGDVAVIRSGPASSSDYAVTFTKGELVKDMEFYKENKWATVFAAREQSRASRMGGWKSGSGF